MPSAPTHMSARCARRSTRAAHEPTVLLRVDWSREQAARPDSSPDGELSVKKIGFLSFGHWTPSPQSQVRTAADALLQSIELAVAAEELGADGAYFRVHHFARQLG